MIDDTWIFWMVLLATLLVGVSTGLWIAMVLR